MQCSVTTHNGLNMPFQRTCAPYLLAYSDHTSDSQKDISIYLWGVANTLYFTLFLRIISTQKRPFSLLKKSLVCFLWYNMSTLITSEMKLLSENSQNSFHMDYNISYTNYLLYCKNRIQSHVHHHHQKEVFVSSVINVSIFFSFILYFLFSRSTFG